MDPNQQLPVEQPQMPNEQPPAAMPAADEQAMQWQAPEYLSGDRTPLWFISFWGAVVVLMIIAAVLIQSWSFVILIPVMAAALMMYTHRAARMMTYVVSTKGLYINDQLHPLSEFRSFGVLQEDSMPSLLFIPTKRFRPAITVYFPQEIGEPLVDFLGARVPMQPAKLDAFDKLVRKLHL